MKLYVSAFSTFIILVLAVVFGVQLGLYDTIPQIDKVFHILGGMAIAAMTLSWFERDTQKMPFWIAVLFAAGITAIVGIGWEIAEASSNSFMKDAFPLFYKYFHGGGLWDTLGDLVADIIGSLLLSVLWLKKVN